MKRLWGLLLVMLLLTGCESFWPASATPTEPPSPTLTPTPVPVPTVTPTLTPEPTVELTPAPTAEALPTPGGAFIVAQNEGEGVLATAALTLVQLTPGRKYRVEVISNAGAVAFTGLYTNWASDAGGTPALDTQTLTSNTPAQWTLQAPLAAPVNWTYSISVQTTAGHIRVIIWDVTDAS